MSSNGDMVKARDQANAPPPQGAWLVYSHKTLWARLTRVRLF